MGVETEGYQDSGVPTVSAVDLDESNMQDCPEATEQKKSEDNEHKKTKVPSVSVEEVPKGQSNATKAIDDLVRQNTIDSDRDYRRITETIIDISRSQLEQQTKSKQPLRKNLSRFIMGLLIAQLGILVAILFLNRVWNLQISDFILNVYIISVFVETLAGLIIMIKFAFDTKQEVDLISILNAIISNFKKYDEK